MKKTFLLLIVILITTGTAVAQVQIGEGVQIGQDEANITTEGEFNVSNLEAEPTSTVLDRVIWEINSSASVTIGLEYFERGAETGEYLTNFSATSTSEVNFTYDNLQKSFYQTLANGTEIKVAEATDRFYFFSYDSPNLDNFSIINFKDRDPPQFTNVGISDPDAIYLINDPDTFDLFATVTDEDTGLSQVKLSTNETREFRNYSLEYGGIKEFNGEEREDVAFTWDNAFNIRDNRLVAWTIWAEDEAGNWNRTSYRYFEIQERPVIDRVKAEDIRQGEISQLQAYVVDPVGFADIVNVTFTVTTPDNEEYTVRARRGRKIEIDGYEGNVYQYNFTNTVEPGAYLVTATAYDETASDSLDTTFTVGPLLEVLKKFLLNPFYLGNTTIVDAVIIIIKQRLNFFIGLLALSAITVYGIVSTENNLSRELYERIKAARQQVERR